MQTKTRLFASMLSMTLLAGGFVNATVITTAGSGTGAFAVGVSSPFETASFETSSASFDSTNLGWRNNSSDSAFSQMIQFNLTGFEILINDAGNTIELSLNSVTNLGGSTGFSVWFAGVSNVDVRSLGNFNGNSLLTTFALPTTGTNISGTETTSGVFSYDVTSILQSLDLSTNKHAYFRVQITGPTSNPGGTPLGSAALDGSTLTVIPEPGTLALVGIALGSMLFFRRRV